MSKAPNRVLPLVSGSIIQLCVGIIYVWSVFKAPFVDYYSNYVAADVATTYSSLTYSLMLAFFVVGIIVGGLIGDKKGPRPAVLLGGLMFFGGIFMSYICSAFLPESPWLVSIFYGCVAGFGVGGAYTSTISCAQKWYMDKKGFATGVIICTFGASTVVFTPLVNELLKMTSLPQTFLILSIIFLAVILIFAWPIKNPTEEYMLSKTPPHMKASNQKQYTPKEVLKSKQFYVILVCMILSTSAYFVVSPFFKILGETRGLSESAAVVSIMLTGVASASGRLIAPWISDKIGRKPVVIALFVITIAATFMLIFAQGYLYSLLIALISFALGGGGGTYPVVTADNFGTKNSGINYGLVMTGYAFSALFFPALSSAISASSTPTLLTFVVPGIACIAGTLIALLLKPTGVYKKAKA